MAIIHHGQDSLNPSALAADNDRNVWVIKTDDGTTDEIQMEVKIHLETEDDDSSRQEELMVSVRVDDGPAGDPVAAIGTLVDSTGVEGRQPTQGKIEAACTRSLATRSRLTSRCHPVVSNRPILGHSHRRGNPCPVYYIMSTIAVTDCPAPFAMLAAHEMQLITPAVGIKASR